MPSAGSSKNWRKPRTVQEFAEQVNQVATLLLNRTIDLDVARAYSSLARTVSQAMSTEIAAARLERRRPNLNIGNDPGANDGNAQK